MNYNYPVYNPYYQQAQSPNNSIIWVQGEAGAKSYLVAPNNTVQLWDSESKTIYLKSADASGMPSMKILDYTIRDEAPQNARGAILNTGAEIPTQNDIKALQEQIDAIRSQLHEMREGTFNE